MIFVAIKIVLAAGAIFLALCLLATQIMDMYYVRTGETWEERVNRLKKRRNEQKQEKGTRSRH